MPIPKKRRNAHIENVSGVPSEVREKYREGTHIGTVWDKEHVVSTPQLRKKYSEED
jgi:hypothetical protein